MPIYQIKWLKISTSGRPYQSSQIKLCNEKLTTKVPKNANLLNKMAQNAHVWSPQKQYWLKLAAQVDLAQKKLA